MHNALSLTADEQKLFDALPDGLKEGWVITEEQGTYSDTPRHRMMRMQLMHLHDPKMQEFLGKAKATEGDEKALAALVARTDLSDVSDGDLAELFFVLGPAPLSALILSLLRAVKSDEDIDDLASLTLIRNSLLSALHHS
ncbi:MAG: hypothetical protein PHU04_03910 [Candidatus Peribacteraceae bacterium]|nr:hypothetical protein [Candidatus Peribacteraceae bacterium]